MNYLKQIFSKEIINKTRQPEIDLLRGFTLLVLFECHVGLYLGNSDNVALFVFSDIIGSELGAPMFMTLMGISIIYSTKQKPKDLLLRGLYFLILGYLQNFFRSLLPLLILGPIDPWASIETFFIIDIFQFCGLTFIFLALLKKLKINNQIILLLSLILVYIDQWLMLPEHFFSDNLLIISLTNFFVPIDGYSCFPFFIWFFFPALGLNLGQLLIHCQNKEKLYKILLPIGLAAVIYVYYQFYKLFPNYTDYYYGNNFYYMGLQNILLNGLFVCFALSFWYFANKYFLPKPIKKGLTFLSKNITIIYIISWLVIGALIHAQALFNITFNTIETLLLMVAIILICSLPAKLLKRKTQN